MKPATSCEQFEQVFSKNKLPDDMPTFTWHDLAGDAESAKLVDLMGASELFKSKGAIRRLIQQGGVKADGTKQSDLNAEFTARQASRSSRQASGSFSKWSANCAQMRFTLLPTQTKLLSYQHSNHTRPKHNHGTRNRHSSTPFHPQDQDR